jgi:hypothetical protein
MLDRALEVIDDHPREREALVVVLADQVARLQQLVDALQRQEARLRDHDQAGRASQRVEGLHTEARRTVDEHDLVPLDLLELVAQHELVRRRAARSLEARAVSAGATSKP